MPPLSRFARSTNKVANLAFQKLTTKKRIVIRKNRFNVNQQKIHQAQFSQKKYRTSQKVSDDGQSFYL